ncbi:unnamed protein product [Boreogadus saida]
MVREPALGSQRSTGFDSRVPRARRGAPEALPARCAGLVLRSQTPPWVETVARFLHLLPPSTLTRKSADRCVPCWASVNPQPSAPPPPRVHGGVEGGTGAQTRVPVVPAFDPSARTAERQPGQS